MAQTGTGKKKEGCRRIAVMEIKPNIERLIKQRQFETPH
jgi:hypothetical protein